MPDLAGLIAKQGSDLRLRQAIVTAAPSGGKCTIRFGDLASTTTADDIPGVHYLSGVGINNGDTVHVLQTGGALLILGRVAGAADAYPNWTPVITQGVTPTQVVNSARYQRIGRFIHAYGDVSLTSAGTAGQPISITGLPVAIRGLGMGIFRYFDAGNTNFVGAGLAGSGTTLTLFYQADGNAFGVGQPTIANGDVIHFMVIYEAVT